MTSGKIGVSTQDLFPIIKKFLYSDHEIFLREIISNAVDATQKLKTLSSSGVIKGDLGELAIRVILDKDKGTLTISDSGLGMTKDEVEKYINQIAFSGAEEFLNKYKDSANAIIGHFGLGFYSSFMVSKKVEILTKSYKKGKAVRWICEGTTDYTLEDAVRSERGTDIIMYLNDDDKEFLEESRIAGMLRKYCRFLPIEIIFGKEKEWKDGKDVETDKDNIINITQPAWTRKPSDLKVEDYTEFYKELYPMAQDPLFHIHLNVDYPFNLTGILYFPKINSKLELQKNKIQLYSNQVYVTDTVEGIVPDYLTLLHGVIDSPDIPLNVSRSYLQSDRNVKKIASHITKKVADSLAGLFKNERSDFESKWDDLKIFVQYGMLTDEKFAEKAVDFYLFKNTDSKYFSKEEYVNAIKENQTDKDNKVVFLYATDKDEQFTYIKAAKAKGYDVLLMNGQLETPFVNLMEQKNSDYRFVRVDSDTADKLIPKENTSVCTFSADEKSELDIIFNSHLPKDGGMYMVSFEAMGEDSEAVIITRSEFMRRMKEMAQINPEMSFYGSMGDQYNLVVNSDNAIVKNILAKEKEELSADLQLNYDVITKLTAQKEEIDTLNKDAKPEDIPASDKDRKVDLDKLIGEEKAKQKEVLTQYASGQDTVGQLIDLALLSNGLLKGEALDRFVKRSVSMLA